MCEGKARLVVFQSTVSENNKIHWVTVKFGNATQGMTDDLRVCEQVLLDKQASSFFGDPTKAVLIKTMLDPGYLDLPEQSRKDIESMAEIFHVQFPVRP